MFLLNWLKGVILVMIDERVSKAISIMMDFVTKSGRFDDGQFRVVNSYIDGCHVVLHVVFLNNFKIEIYKFFCLSDFITHYVKLFSVSFREKVYSVGDSFCCEVESYDGKGC